MKTSTPTTKARVISRQMLHKHLRHHEAVSESSGLRERKRIALRQQLSDMATELFLERGFENVRITDIAQACNVSEKTVYNHFPVKEGLLLDRESDMMLALHDALEINGGSPVAAMIKLLENEVGYMVEGLEQMGKRNEGIIIVRRFFSIIESNPSLLAYQQNIMDRLTNETALLLAKRAHLLPEAPEIVIIAEMLVGLWRLQHQALRRYITLSYTLQEIANLVCEEVYRAAQIVEASVKAFDPIN